MHIHIIFYFQKKDDKDDGDENKDPTDADEEKKDAEKSVEGDPEKEASGGETKDAMARVKDAQGRVKDALENMSLPKMPKLHKPAFLKKKKGETEGEEKKDEEKVDVYDIGVYISMQTDVQSVP